MCGSKPAVADMEKNQCEYHEYQTQSNSWETNNDMHDDLRKMTSQKTGRYCVEVIV